MARGDHDLSWFEPGVTQEEFINWFGKESVFAGGVGSGKTLSGCVKAMVASQVFPGTVGLVGRQSYRALEDTTQKVMIYGDDKPPIIPLDSPLVADWAKSDNRLTLTNGSEIIFRSLEPHNIEKILSLNLGWFYVDELTETTLSVWTTLLGRLRHPVGPRIGWGTTNPNGHDWVWKRFHSDGSSAPVGKMFIQPTEANRKHLAADYITMLRTMPAEWQKRFVDASFDTAAGMIWDQWNREVHVYDADLVGQLPAHWKRLWCMDHGRRNPTCVLFLCVDPDGNMIVEDEYYVAGKTPSEHAQPISAKATMITPGVDILDWGPLIGPPDIFRQDPNGKTIEGEYLASWQRMDVPIRFSRANDNVQAGLLRVAEWLRRDPEDYFPDWHPLCGTRGTDERGAPRLFVSNKCVELIGEIPDYRWKDLPMGMEDLKDPSEEPRKLADHGCDALRYGVMSRARPRFERTEGSKDPDAHREDRRAFSAGVLTKRF